MCESNCSGCCILDSAPKYILGDRTTISLTNHTRRQFDSDDLNDFDGETGTVLDRWVSTTSPLQGDSPEYIYLVEFTRFNYGWTPTNPTRTETIRLTVAEDCFV